MTSLNRASADVSPRTLTAGHLHDLRTPLNHIIGYAELLAEQAEEEGQSGYLADLRKIHTAGRQMLTLLKNGESESQTTVGHEPESLPSAEHVISATAERGAASASAAMILVVDDNAGNRDLLSERLGRQGYAVTMAANGRAALEVVRAGVFDLVLLDIMMPEMDGYTVLQQLKADEGLRHIPVIMISALDELDSVVRCIELGADDYLPKPFEPTLLKARIGSCLEKKAARDREMGLYTELQRNHKRLQELETLRDDLTNMIIHDLRTPLSSVILGMQTLQGVGELDDMQREMVEIAISGGHALLGMINDLLDVEKLESGSMQLESDVISFAELAASAVRQVSTLAEGKGLSLACNVVGQLPPLRGDEGKLRRVLVNLLGNAIKFTPSGGTVTVSARSPDGGRSTEFSVQDTGEGIPAESFDRIFEKFGQVQTRRGGRTMSTGLGLTFCKLAVEAHGGHIRVESEPGKGSTFAITIPQP